MNPLDARSPRALFGDAVDDARALKRAYARLIREFAPETHPEVFQHVRRLYEEAQADPTAAVLPLPTAAPAPGPGEDAWVDEQLARLDAACLFEVRAALRERAFAVGSVPALVAGVGLAAAGDPGEAIGLCAEAVAQAALLPVAVDLAESLASASPELVDDPRWDALAREVSHPAARACLAEADVRARLALGRTAEVWARWEAVEAELRIHAPDRWRNLLPDVLVRASWDAPRGAVERWIGRLGAADLGLPEGHADSLATRLCRVLGWQAAAGAPLREEARALCLADPIERLGILHALAARPTLEEEVERLASSDPGVAAMLGAGLQLATRRDHALFAWLEQGVDAVLPPKETGEPVVAAMRAVIGGWREAQADVDRARKAAGKPVGWMTVGGSLGLMAGVGTAGAHGLLGGGIALVSLAVLAVAVVLSKRIGDRHRAPPPLDREALVLETCRANGLWLHEIAALASRMPELSAALDGLLADPLSDLRVLGDMHVRRAATALAVARRAR